MELHSNSNRGFTLIEVLVTLGIIVLVLGFSLNVGFDTYNRAGLNSERALIVRYLQQVRGRAIANIGGERHGFAIDRGDYVLFQGDSLDSGELTTTRIEPREGITVNGVESTGVTIMFYQNSGQSSGGTIVVEDGTSSSTITVNGEGAIIW